ncbi:hypothetical protein SAMN06295945_0996 [Polynucleobacter meluiroseus]|uniref:Uncharacterized protein n=1 Tax=Polynucleobacter meluiroseus TaxID=1938814 RepID=A0A240E2F3_9BURK|nr:hypothetical protein [Polynucleobacter meluiroseus]SNX28656.1 hypothetical protein SAMN06295945_0996 [Polynucleobacter meluiroseus]
MSVQMIELEEVQMVEASDDVLEASCGSKGASILFGTFAVTDPQYCSR